MILIIGNLQLFGINHYQGNATSNYSELIITKVMLII